jgi:hypothetical protein
MEIFQYDLMLIRNLIRNLSNLTLYLLQINNNLFCVFMFAHSIKALFIIPTDTHNYKITGMLKQLKFRQLHCSAFLYRVSHACTQAGMPP